MGAFTAKRAFDCAGLLEAQQNISEALQDEHCLPKVRIAGNDILPNYVHTYLRFYTVTKKS